MEFFERIKLRREELRLSQEELAQRLGYRSRSSINKIESGENDIPQTKIKAFALALQTTPAYLMGWNDDDKNIHPDAIPATKQAPILGSISAGIPLEQQEDICGYLPIPPDMQPGNYYYLDVNGDSMEPQIPDGSRVLVREDMTCQDGKVCVIQIESEFTIKRVYRFNGRIELVPDNPHYQRQVYTSGTVKILGTVQQVVNNVK